MIIIEVNLIDSKHIYDGIRLYINFFFLNFGTPRSLANFFSVSVKLMVNIYIW